MGDVKGNPVVEIFRQKMTISNVQATIDRMKFENEEMKDRRTRNDITIAESEKLIVELHEKVAEMESRQE